MWSVFAFYGQNRGNWGLKLILCFITLIITVKNGLTRPVYRHSYIIHSSPIPCSRSAAALQHRRRMAPNDAQLGRGRRRARHFQPGEDPVKMVNAWKTAGNTNPVVQRICQSGCLLQTLGDGGLSVPTGQ